MSTGRLHEATIALASYASVYAAVAPVSPRFQDLADEYDAALREALDRSLQVSPDAAGSGVGS